ncbi:MAG: HU family DNA-binding protein [Holosporales bacterium]|jgi:DNA-binding protein HU-beta
MNKNELIGAIADHSGLSKADTTRALDAALEIISKTLRKGGDVRLVGFGTFLVTKRQATEGRNPRTGQKIKIAASTQPKFRAGKSLKDLVNKK